MKLVLARHGNTFAPGEKVVWAGSRNDLPLVPRGYEQAAALNVALQPLGTRLAAVYCGPLSRTRVYADTAVAGLGLSPQIDARLNEIDYGAWSGLSTDQVIARFGDAAWRSWEECGAWPDAGDWGSDPAAHRQAAQLFLADLERNHTPADAVVLAVTSNGALRFFAALCGAIEAGGRVPKVKTGHICVVECTAGKRSILGWDMHPSAAALD